MSFARPRFLKKIVTEYDWGPNWLYHHLTPLPPFNRAWVSAAVLQMPRVEAGSMTKGAIILNHVDAVLEIFPALASLFFLIERRGWWGVNDSRRVDIKFVEDGSTLAFTRRRYPRAILLDLSGADFVDHDAFRPLSLEPDFDVIQVSCWSPRKRIELLIDAAARLPHLRFVHLGHLENRGSEEELRYREECLRKAAESGANMTFPFADAREDADIPTDKESINNWINRARMGVLTTAPEGRNRFKMECLCADRPMLVPEDTAFPTRKFIGSRTGGFFRPDAVALAAAIEQTLGAIGDFRPRETILNLAGLERSMQQLKDALRQVCERAGQRYDFDGIRWDGRNQSMLWGEIAMEHLQGIVRQYKPA